jgi:hypothetical protein
MIRPNWPPSHISLTLAFMSNDLEAFCHSTFKLFTGLTMAARIVCKLTVSSATTVAATPASTKIHQGIDAR